MARSLASRKADAKARKFRRDTRPSLREKAIKVVRAAFENPADAKHQILAAARGLIMLAQQI